MQLSLSTSQKFNTTGGTEEWNTTNNFIKRCSSERKLMCLLIKTNLHGCKGFESTYHKSIVWYRSIQFLHNLIKNWMNWADWLLKRVMLKPRQQIICTINFFFWDDQILWYWINDYFRSIKYFLIIIVHWALHTNNTERWRKRWCNLFYWWCHTRTKKQEKQKIKRILEKNRTKAAIGTKYLKGNDNFSTGNSS